MRAALLGPFAPLVVALLTCVSRPVAAQQGSLVGTVRDASTGEPMAGVQIQVIGGPAAAAGGTFTSESGGFRVDLPGGRYSVVATMVGYRTFRRDGVEVGSGRAVHLAISMESRAVALNPLVVSVGRGEQEKALDAPAAVSVVPRQQITDRAATTPVDYVKALPGVDVAQTGLDQSNTVTRGFNNVFSGALLVMVDDRYASVPSLGLNAFDMIPTTPLDIQRVEVVLGPASALYGPNASNGVLHVITKSPIDYPGTELSVSGGSRNIFQGALRQAWKFNDQLGFKVSGQYFRGNDFVYRDPVEEADSAQNPSNRLIGARDFNAQHYGASAELDWRPWDDGEVAATYGYNDLAHSIELTGLGAGQAKGWIYQYGQVRVKKGRFFAQTFLNKNDAGGTWLLRTGMPVVDRSTFWAGQAQYGLTPAKGLDLITGVDVSRTNPITDGTITGVNEGHDNTTDAGAYAQATKTLTRKFDVVGALRVDYDSNLANLVLSPRAALEFKPRPGQTFRLTFNRAFDTPTTDNLFLDILAGRLPITSSLGYEVRTEGVPSTGYTWTDRCAGGYGPGYCMYSPFATGQLPANGAAVWNQVLQVAAQNPVLQGALTQMGLTAQQFAAIVANPGAGDLQTILQRFNSENPQVPFLPDAAGPRTVSRLRPTITNTLEAGYKGLLADRLRLAVDVYSTWIKDFVGPLRVETPSVFLTSGSVATFVTGRLVAAGVPAGAAQQLAGEIALGLAQIPLGTVAPDQRHDDALVLTYRNFGSVNLWGSDLGVELLATDRLSLNGSFSYVSKQCFDFNRDGNCYSTQDVALNAPQERGSLGVRYDDKLAGFSVEGRMRYSGAFPMNSGVYVGRVDQYTVFDANVAYEVPWASGTTMSLTVSNLFNDWHQEFVGAPKLGRIALVRMEYDF